jgi:hypothetical protein
MVIIKQDLLACAVIFLSFWAEVHYNSIYPEGGKIYVSSYYTFIGILGK